ncbi:hypothetical protein V6N11_023676 [Hibiscus sabdariffa]|uniref:Uncharacterized protein n=1 Tax=Hibiscus sabdariffa TaxID=183260 RepID=A0ABR2TNV3_9ROSI
MKDEDSLPTSTTTNLKKESSESILFGKGRYKCWALAAILLLALWSMFTGTVTLRWSAGNLNRLSDDLDSPLHDDLDVLSDVSNIYWPSLSVPAPFLSSTKTNTPTSNCNRSFSPRHRSVSTSIQRLISPPIIHKTTASPQPPHPRTKSHP